MLKKIVVFILLFTILLGTIACSTENKEKIFSDAIDKPESAVMQSQSTEKPDKNTSEETDLSDSSNVELIPMDKQIEFPQNIVGTTIPLIKTEYECPNPIIFDDSIWELQSDKSYENVLGTDIQVLYYETDAFTEQNRCTVIIDTKTNLLLYLSYDFTPYDFKYVDIDYDGTKEIHTMNALGDTEKIFIDNQKGKINILYIEKSVNQFLVAQEINATKIVYRIYQDISQVNCIECLFYADDGITYRSSNLFFNLTLEGLLINSEKTQYYNRYLTFTSNDDSYYTEMQYTDDGAILIIHTNSHSFEYTPDELNYAYTSDISYKRELIKHPLLPYFALLYPSRRQCTDDADTQTLVIISSEDGHIVDNSEELYRSFEACYENEQAYRLYKKLDLLGVSINRIVYTVTTIDNGFHYIVSIEDPDGNVLLDYIYEGDIIL